MSSNTHPSNEVTAPASDFKKKGWRRLRRTLLEEGRGTLVITNHNEPEAVILSPQEYARMKRLANEAQAGTEDVLTALRRRFDERLAGLKADDAADRLRAVMDNPAELGGEVKAGDSY